MRLSEFQGDSAISYVPPPPKKACSKKWAELIKLVYEVNPLQCPKCLHEMRIVAIINDPLVVEKILKHLDLWRPQAHSPPVSKETKIVVTASFGVTGFDPNTPDDKISSEAMIKMADKYLYQAKQIGRDRIKAGGL